MTAVSYGFPGPYRGGTWSAEIRVPGSKRTAAEPASVELQSGAARYFATIGSRPLRGRDFEDTDTGQSRRVAIVNEAFAREYLNGTDPVGRVFGFDDKEPGGGDPVTIVGLVRDMLHNGVREHPVPTVYLPFTQTESASDPILLVSAGKKPATLIPTVGRTLGAIDPAIALSDARTIRQRFDDSIFLDRMVASVTVLFAGLSLIIAGVGLYGILSYEVVRRTPEIGIRIALGAEAKDVRWMVVRDGLLLVAAGAAIGIPIAVAGARLARQMVFGIQPADPLTFVASLAFLLLVAVVAAGLPGRRASLVEPIQALRQD